MTGPQHADDLHAPVPPVGLSPAEGWYDDPFGVHESRWISDGEPTSLVRDQGLETDDEPPADRSMPATLTASITEAPGDAADLLRADAALQGEQGFEQSDAMRAAVFSEGDLSTGAG